MRKIIHIDMDAFYASVELRERPDLIDVPVVVAAHHPRAVITTASYPARRFGLRSAMSMAQARKLCPHVVVLEPRFELYRQISTQIQQIFQQYTDLIEPLSLDEAYLDVTENKLGLASATEVAQAIQQQIWQQMQLTASAGVAPNKFLAKIASDWYKPNGLCVIKPQQVQQFIYDLPLKKIPGVGKVTQAKLEQLQLYTLGDLQKIELHVLQKHFGKYGQQLHLYAQGIDERPVVASRVRQQISKEITFDQDLYLSACHDAWQILAEKVWASLEKRQLSAFGVSIKLKQPDFQIVQHSKRFQSPLENLAQLQQAILLLLSELQLSPQLRFRLIGIGVYQLIAIEQKFQLSFWSEMH
ncbi:DNA polymerase IV [Acinetobacter sp. ANC 4635]|uniref:DNA polymerase IV n=1 Tax=Acinetobacter sp. ANC 4635 TaxID=2529846 RepID=UPI0010389643|nr:DNA polymerase IV [Acinetobacter sp. ANC 4635]TCB28550.1 DNA polymerase IV [Acinetobacter sp. ANC 4635]